MGLTDLFKTAPICTGTTKDGKPCKKKAINNTAQCMHHQLKEQVESSREAVVESTQFDDWSQMEIYHYVFNKTKGRVKLDYHQPVPVLAARAVEALA